MKKLLPSLSLALLALCFPNEPAYAVSWTSPARLTHVGPDLDRNFDAREPDIAFNSMQNEFLVVWEGTDNRAGLAIGEAEIYGQRVDAATGELLGATAFRISAQGPDGTANFDARSPSVIYNPAHNEYLVVWSGDDDNGGLVEGEFEIFARRIDGASGALLGQDSLRISDMGISGNRSYDATLPAVSYNSIEDVYLVIWRGEEGTLSTPIGQFEIYGQLLDGASATEVGDNDFRISRMGPDNDPAFDAFDSKVAFNAIANEFMVVWTGDDNTGQLVDEETEIFAQRLDGLTGVLVGPQPIRVSDAGIDGDVTRDATNPDIAWNRDRNEYLVTWSADDDTGGRLNGELEIYGQLLSGEGTGIGQNDFLISNVGGAGNSLFEAMTPSVAYHGKAHQYLVTWHGDDDVDGEFEIRSQRLDGPSLTPLGRPGQRLTNAGPDGDPLYDARRAAIVEDENGGRLFIAFEMEDMATDQTEGEFEVFFSSMETTGFSIANELSASWFDTTHDGEGWVVEIINDNLAAVYWFTYRPDLPTQAWMLGIGHVIDNRIVMTDVVIPSGATFGPQFDPAMVQHDPWGTFAIEFDSCDQATMNYNSIAAGFGSGAYEPVRLSTLGDLDCSQTTVTPDANAFISGSWFDPSHDGEGWVLESLGDNRVVMYWFTYDDSGNQAWLIGVGELNGDSIAFDDVLIASGTVFGEAFDPNAVELTHWGTVTMTVSGCDAITVEYSSVDQRFGSGLLNAQRLVALAGIDCP